MVSADQPISNKEQDALGRALLAQKVSEVILKYGDKSKESFVIGVDGAWGSGKTSFINLIMGDLGNRVIPLHFNPWIFSDQNSLLESFFVVFAQTVEPYVGKDTLGSFKRYSKAVADVDLGFSVFGVGISPLKLIDSVASLFGDSSLTGQRNRINNGLSRISKKIVIVIDDIDRLDPEETKLIFKLVKVSANFKNTIFLVSYDRARVAKQLSSGEGKFDGNEYLKKIIQVNFLLPTPEPEDLWDLLFPDLNDTLREVYGSDDIGDDRRWSELFHGGLKGFFQTIRDVKSFINSLRLNWAIIGGHEVNPIDFIGIEAIRVFATEFYGHIGGNQALFTGERFFAGLGRDEDAKAKKSNIKNYSLLLPRVFVNMWKEYVMSYFHSSVIPITEVIFIWRLEGESEYALPIYLGRISSLACQEVLFPRLS